MEIQFAGRKMLSMGETIQTRVKQLNDEMLKAKGSTLNPGTGHRACCLCPKQRWYGLECQA